MAKVTIKYAPIAPAPPPEKTGVTLELSIEEAEFLTTIMGKTSGSTHGGGIFRALVDNNIKQSRHYQRHLGTIRCAAAEKAIRGDC